MAGLSVQNVAKIAGFSLAGSGIVVLIGIFCIGMLIISLIPVYLPNESIEGFGEIYTIPSLTIKAIYTNVSLNFSGGNVINTAELSNICTRILRERRIPGFYACLATNFTVYGPTGNLDRNSVVQRRALDDVAVYEIGNIQLIFSSTCSNQRPIGVFSTDLRRRQNSSCYFQRINFCRQFITTPNIGNLGNQWSPFPDGYTQLIVSNVTFLGCTTISISDIYNVAFFHYGTLFNRYNISRSWLYGGDCYLDSIVSQQTIRNLVDRQTFPNVSTCLSTSG